MRFSVDIEVRQFSDNFLNLVEEIDFFERGWRGEILLLLKKKKFGPLFYYLSECNSSFGLV